MQACPFSSQACLLHPTPSAGSKGSRYCGVSTIQPIRISNVLLETSKTLTRNGAPRIFVRYRQHTVYLHSHTSFAAEKYQYHEQTPITGRKKARTRASSLGHRLAMCVYPGPMLGLNLDRKYIRWDKVCFLRTHSVLCHDVLLAFRPSEATMLSPHCAIPMRHTRDTVQADRPYI